jgi:hypothetical protein
MISRRASRANLPAAATINSLFPAIILTLKLLAAVAWVTKAPIMSVKSRFFAQFGAPADRISPSIVSSSEA